jgi:hypothetical protein
MQVLRKAMRSNRNRPSPVEPQMEMLADERQEMLADDHTCEHLGQAAVPQTNRRGDLSARAEAP